MRNSLARGALAFVVWFSLFFAGKALIVSGIGHNRPFALVFAVVLLVAYYACARWIERREPRELNAHRWSLVIAGALVGLLLFLATIGILALMGTHRVAQMFAPASLAGGAIASFAAAAGEELLFRGYIFRWLEAGTGTWIAIAISAALFGLAHGLNRGTTPVDVVAIAVEAGVMLSAAYVVSQTLWLPIGIHFGWDLAGSAFGHGNSGVEETPVAILLCTLCAAVFLVLAYRNGSIKRPIWRLGQRTSGSLAQP